MSAERPDSTPDGGDVLELQALVGSHKSEAMRELARQLVSAAQYDQQPTQWVQACMSQAGWKYAHLLRAEAGCIDEAVSAITEPALHVGR